MPAIGTLVLTDRESTPVDHTFVPAAEDRNGVWTLRESSGVPIADNIVTLGLKQTPSRFKREIRFTFPVVQTETINGISTPKVVRTARARIEFDFDVNSTTQERDNCVGMVQSALDGSEALTDGMIVNLEGVY